MAPSRCRLVTFDDVTPSAAAFADTRSRRPDVDPADLADDSTPAIGGHRILAPGFEFGAHQSACRSSASHGCEASSTADDVRPAGGICESGVRAEQDLQREDFRTIIPRPNHSRKSRRKPAACRRAWGKPRRVGTGLPLNALTADSIADHLPP